MQPSAVLFSHLFRRNNFATKLSELNKLMLDRQQPFIPLSVSDLSICSIQAVTPKLLIQFLNISDLFSEAPNLVPKNQKMIHVIRITYPDNSGVVERNGVAGCAWPRLLTAISRVEFQNCRFLTANAAWNDKSGRKNGL